MCPFRVRARVADMDLPVAPPAFDATTGSGRRRRADLGADIGAGCGLVVLELIALVVVLGLWFLSGFNLDPAESAAPDPLWNYVAAVGGVGAFAGVAAAVAARAGAVVTVVGQAVVVGLVCAVVFGGVALQSHQDQRCREMPAATGCTGSGRGGSPLR
ncbi:hypothetical protein SLITK23_38740 [Streptomyces lividans]|uniref:Integral membrane protein n=4 Tax=Streptomyces TaxID=1883 RepID=Q7AKK7_STRCO|nr:hypothetical protein SLIV_18355 [Streptomyces lividans TK24]MYU43534.1 hypothetical protein [Streptomyces sp. SID7813]QFI44000.1 hypothetical protein FQ762_20670 [Streptomyces coelicolor A3(2)]QSJ10166.1 hypothetical protein SLIVDG2_18355 [Streptomyces lividans]TYP00860.1 hypothetical protein FHV91_13317 [Streptomyces coelicolor]